MPKAFRIKRNKSESVSLSEGGHHDSIASVLPSYLGVVLPRSWPMFFEKIEFTSLDGDHWLLYICSEYSGHGSALSWSLDMLFGQLIQEFPLHMAVPVKQFGSGFTTHVQFWCEMRVRVFVMDIVYMTHILLIHFITTRTFDIESLYHSTYFLNISFKTVFYH